MAGRLLAAWAIQGHTAILIDKRPTGITTRNKRLQRGLNPVDKAERVRHYADSMQYELGVIAHSCGVPEPRRLRPFHCRIVSENGRSIPLNELYPECKAA